MSGSSPPPALGDVPLETVEHNVLVPPRKRYCGEDGLPHMRGIQGEHNSCYLDATLFGLFALSSEFDQPLIEMPKGEVEREIRDILWTRIINPLRQYCTPVWLDLTDHLHPSPPSQEWCCEV